MEVTSPTDSFCYMFEEATQEEPSSKGTEGESSLLQLLSLCYRPPAHEHHLHMRSPAMTVMFAIFPSKREMAQQCISTAR